MTSVDRFKVGLVQLNSALGDSSANLERAIPYIAKAAGQGADLVMFPELYLQGYRADELNATTAEPIPGPSTERLLAEARKHDIYIVMGMARLEEEYPHLVYNSLCFIGPEGMVEYYDKIHLGTFHPYMEGVYFAPGQRTPVFDTRFGRVSLQICYDACFPELTRTYAVMGSVVNLVISAGPSVAKDTWKIILQARSLENLFPSVYCNVVGTQKDFSFFGGSKIRECLRCGDRRGEVRRGGLYRRHRRCCRGYSAQATVAHVPRTTARPVRPADCRAARFAARREARIARRGRDRSPHGSGRRVAARAEPAFIWPLRGHDRDDLLFGKPRPPHVRLLGDELSHITTEISGLRCALLAACRRVS